MTRGRSLVYGLVSLLLVSVVAAELIVVSENFGLEDSPGEPPVYEPVYDGEDPPTYDDDSETPPDTTFDLSGSARLFGPLSAGCQATIIGIEQTSETTSGGLLTAPRDARIVVGTCKDTFTGLDVPAAVAGRSRSAGKFYITPVTSIAAASSRNFTTSPAGPVQFAYAQLGASPAGAADLDTTDVYAQLRAGKTAYTFSVLAADLKWMATTNLLSSAVLLKKGDAQWTCTNRVMVHGALAAKAASATTPMGSTPADTTARINALVPIAACGVPQATANALVAGPLPTVISQVAADIDAASNARGPVFKLAYLARWASVLTSAAYTDDITYARLADALPTAPVVPSEIAAALGLTGYSSLDSTVKVVSVGPLSGAQLKYRSFDSVSEAALAPTDTAGAVTNLGAKAGLYTVEAGATDMFLTADVTKPKRTALPFTVAVPFTGSTKGFTISPVGALVAAKWLEAQTAAGDVVPALPTAADYKAAYEALAGPLPDRYDYFARTYEAGSATALAVFACDVVAPSLPNLGGTFILGAIKTASPGAVHAAFSKAIHGKSATELSNANTITSILVSVYMNIKQSQGSRRSLLQTSEQLAQLSTVLGKIASSIASTNTMASALITQATTALATNSVPPATAFVTLSQVAAVQSESIAAEIAAVADLIAAGSYDAAVTRAEEVVARFTGDALNAAVAAAPVNSAAIKASTVGPNTTPEVDGSSGLSSGATVGLAVGLSVGLSALAAIGIGMFIYMKKKRASYDAGVSVPVATAEAMEEGNSGATTAAEEPSARAT